MASLETLTAEYQELLTNDTIGYSKFLSQQSTNMNTSHQKRKEILQGGIHGTWDDHDYGGNDYGHTMTQKSERRAAFFDFLQQSNDALLQTSTSNLSSEERKEQQGRKTERLHMNRNGVYHSVTFGTPPRQVQVLFLDTRWSRQHHCIPSLATTKMPLGNIFACLTRLITAGILSWPPKRSSSSGISLSSCLHQSMLGADQWSWLEQQVQESQAQVVLVVSSVQVLTTNPVVESWGHYPKERERLLSILNEIPEAAVVILSGDVHHGELLHSHHVNRDNDLRNGGIGILEVTSSGLTHSCSEPFYGSLCAPILDAFSSHRYISTNGSSSTSTEMEKNALGYFTGRNFGSIEIDWGDQGEDNRSRSTEDSHNMISISRTPSMKVNVHNHEGAVVLTAGSHPFEKYSSHMSDVELKAIPNCINGHLIPILSKFFGIITWIGIILIWRRYTRQSKVAVHTPNQSNRRLKSKQK